MPPQRSKVVVQLSKAWISPCDSVDAELQTTGKGWWVGRGQSPWPANLGIRWWCCGVILGHFVRAEFPHSLNVFLLSLTHLAENSVSKTESQRARDEQKRKVRLEDNCTDDQIRKQHILLCRQKHCSLLIWRVRLPSRLCRRPLRRQYSSVERAQALGSENQLCLALLGFHAYFFLPNNYFKPSWFFLSVCTLPSYSITLNRCYFLYIKETLEALEATRSSSNICH